MNVLFSILSCANSEVMRIQKLCTLMNQDINLIANKIQHLETEQETTLRTCSVVIKTEDCGFE
jgi:hypothetical protein